MQTLHIQLLEVEKDIVELRYFFEQKSQYEKQILKLSEIQTLLKQAKQDYYLGTPALLEIGQQLFFWLDGYGRWLSKAIDNCLSEGLILAIATSARLAHLPWEALHDGTDFLVRRVNPVVVPVRWSNRPTPAKPIQARPLQVLFMATSPEEVEAVLDFEREEARILENTQELPLVLRVEESGCITQLDKLWSRYREPFDVFHLTGHAGIPIAPPHTPYFVTETETGDRYNATAEEIWNVFRYRPPQLVFLSGCRTGQAADDGAVPSLAQALIEKGATAVLGWGRPVTDVAATTAAAYLYGELAAGYQLSEALASTYQHLWEQGVNDWHLLRLYVRGECPGALVEPLGDYIWQPPEPADELFLDPVTQLVRVATRLEFVGRRWILQHCLKALRSPNNLGVLLHGLGGVGKSTVAARLLERMAGYDDNMIFIHQQLDEAKLLTTLSQQCTSEQGLEILNGKLPLMQRLTKFLQQGLNYPEQRFVFVLDDFEANLESRADGQQVLKIGAIEVLIALLKAIANSKLPHRLIITCRYNFQLPELDCRLDRQPLAALQGADLRKKCDRLISFNAQSEIAPSLQERAKKTADGNPRLLEWLDKILRDEQLDRVKIIEQMEGKAAQFLADILAEELMMQQPEALRKMLGWSLVYELPVPKTAIAAICSSIPKLDDYINRATALGLLELSNTQAELHYRVPPILGSLLQPFKSDSEELYSAAAQFLDQIWYQQARDSTDIKLFEIHRLALLGKETKIAVEVADILANYWNKYHRYREVVSVCTKTLKLERNYRIVHRLAVAERVLGEPEALQHCEEALQLFPQDGDQSLKAEILHNNAGLLNLIGQIKKAFTLYKQCYEISKHLNDELGQAMTMHEMAGMHAGQGEAELALDLYQQCLSIFERQNNMWYKALTLHEMAGIYVDQGKLEKALELLQQSYELSHDQGNIQAEGAALHEIGHIFLLQGNWKAARKQFQQSYKIAERIGSIKDQASALHEIGRTYLLEGDLEAAQDFFSRSMELVKRIGSIKDQAATLHEIAELNCLQGQDDRAITLYQKSLQLEAIIGNVQGQSITLLEIGSLELKRGNFDTSLAKLQKALNLFESIKSPYAERARVIISVVQEMAQAEEISS